MPKASGFMFSEAEKARNETQRRVDLDRLFNDFEARSNIVGLYDLLLKIDRRISARKSGASEKPVARKHD